MPKAHLITKTPSAAVTIWLFICCAMIFIMALIGAATRLTESGLSITTWDPIIGALPPLTTAAWDKAFSAYQNIPQYQILNRGMGLDAFKGLYYWEWAHRLWGRLIGIVFLIPLIIFAVHGHITRKDAMKFLAIFILGAFQGFIGWFMVQSGLEGRTSVSPYRLALHLGFALAIYSVLLWMVFGRLKNTSSAKIPGGLMRHGWAALGFLVITMTWGAFTAGLHAGEVYNTWPSMEGAFVPDTINALQPMWRNFFENPALVQFTHRWLGPTTFVMIIAWVCLCWRHANANDKPALAALGIMAIAQVALGIGTVMSHAEIVVAVIHQAGAITLLSLLLFNLNRFFLLTAHRK